MKLFQLNRIRDISGVSGTGIVAEGVEFSNGKCVMSWLTGHQSIIVYDDMKTLVAVHERDGNAKILYPDTPDTVISYNNSKIDVGIDVQLQLLLTPTEYKLLKLLKDNSGRVMTHLEIANKMWGEVDELSAADMTRPLCARVRKKMDDPTRIETVRGRGYVYLD